MALPVWSTFSYAANVPPPAESSRPWPVRLHGALERTGNDRPDSRLVGTSPTLEITDAGLTQNPGWIRGRWRPEVLRSRLTFRASERKSSAAGAASFYVDRSLISRLQAGDLLYVARTGCGGVGLSVLRDGRLVVAVGAVTSVPLGSTVDARCPHEVITEAESLFRKLDSTFEFCELPIELTVGGEKAILPGSSSRLQGYEIYVLHGFYRGTPGVNECVAITASGSCPATAANASAQLLDADALDVEQW